jgi:hypothetical protein
LQALILESDKDLNSTHPLRMYILAEIFAAVARNDRITTLVLCDSRLVFSIDVFCDLMQTTTSLRRLVLNLNITFFRPAALALGSNTTIEELTFCHTATEK